MPNRIAKKIIFYLILLISIISTQIPSFGQDQNSEIIPNISEYVIKQRIEALNNNSPIQLNYNKYVQAYIDVYTLKRRDHLAKIIGRSELYFPIFETYLDKYELPLELKYLAIVESALNPKAKSTSGAMGLWQFLLDASKMFDLKVTSFVDERCDPIMSTEAACKYLNYLYRNFNDWQLALAAYNVGPGEVKKAIIKSGGKKTYWEIRDYLPVAAQGYVPAFIAANYVMDTYHLYKIQPTKQKYKSTDIDTLMVRRGISFEQIKEITGLSLNEIEQLNPMYTKNYIPDTGENMPLYLPSYTIPQFISKIMQMETANPNELNDNWQSWNQIPSTHIVQRGEYFHKIAMTYHCTIEEIMDWNQLTSKNINAGQKLLVYKNVPANSFFFITKESIQLPANTNQLVSNTF